MATQILNLVFYKEGRFYQYKNKKGRYVSKEINKKKENLNNVVVARARVLSCFSHVRLCAIPWTVTRQAPLSMGFSRQEYWSGLPCPPPGDIPEPGIEAAPLRSPALAGGFFTTNATWEALLWSLNSFNILQRFLRCKNKLYLPIYLYL